MKRFTRIILTTMVIIGVAKLYISSRAKSADGDWRACIASVTTKALQKNEAAQEGELVRLAIVDCSDKYATVRDRCPMWSVCAIDINSTVLKIVEISRKSFRFEMEAKRKDLLIESSIKDSEKMGLTREDFKDYFRDEILQDQRDEENAEEEAKAGQSDRSQRFGRFDQ